MINTFLRKIVRGDIKGNLANSFRNRRAILFNQFLAKLKKHEIRILDVGGTDYYWNAINVDKSFSLNITLLNPEKVTNQLHGFSYLIGDGGNFSDLRAEDYDMIFSNSVIEHVGDFKEQKKFADEIQKFGIPFFLQTPNYYFPFEPHFLFIGFQFFQIKLKAWLIRHFNLGWYQIEKDYHKSLLLADSVRLLKYNELKNLFPNSKIIREKFLGLTKSFIISKS